MLYKSSLQFWFQTLAKLKLDILNLHLTFILSPFILPSLFVHCSSFVYLPVWLAPSFVRSLFVHCSVIVRSLFVFCSSFVRLAPSFVRSLFVFCSFIVRLLFVFCSSFVRLAPSFIQTLFNFLIFQFFNLLIKIPYDLAPAILSPPPTLVLFSLYSP